MSHLHLRTQVVSSFDVPDYMLRAFTSNDAPAHGPHFVELPDRNMQLAHAPIRHSAHGARPGSAVGPRCGEDADLEDVDMPSQAGNPCEQYGAIQHWTFDRFASRGERGACKSGGAGVKFRMSHPENAEGIVNGKDATWLNLGTWGAVCHKSSQLYGLGAWWRCVSPVGRVRALVVGVTSLRPRAGATLRRRLPRSLPPVPVWGGHMWALQTPVAGAYWASWADCLCLVVEALQFSTETAGFFAARRHAACCLRGQGYEAPAWSLLLPPPVSEDVL